MTYRTVIVAVAALAVLAFPSAISHAQSCFPPCRTGYVCQQSVCVEASSVPANPTPRPPPVSTAPRPGERGQVPTCDGNQTQVARDAARRGRDLYREAVSASGGPDMAKLRQALAEFERQCAAGDDWALEYRASTLLVLGQHLDAARSIDAFLHSHPIATLPADVRARVEGNMPLFTQRVGTIRVVTNAPNAQARIDNGPPAPLDGRVLRVTPGTVRVDVWAPNAANPVGQSVTVAAGQTVEVEMSLSQATVDPVVPDRPNGESADSLTGEYEEPPPPDDRDQTSGGGSLTGLAVATGVVGGLLLAGGIVSTVLHEERVSTYNDEGCPESPEMDGCASVLDEADLTSTLAAIGYIGAGVLAVTTIIVAVAGGGGDDDSQESSAIQCGPVLGDVLGGTCAARF